LIRSDFHRQNANISELTRPAALVREWVRLAKKHLLPNPSTRIKPAPGPLISHSKIRSNPQWIASDRFNLEIK
jgi:hypothetical protein